jgi:hypothetical protein
MAFRDVYVVAGALSDSDAPKTKLQVPPAVT